MTTRLFMKTCFSLLLLLAINQYFTENAEAFEWKDGEWHLEEGEEKLILQPGESVYIPMIYHFIVEGEHKQKWKSLHTGQELPEQAGASEYANWDGEITGNMGVTLRNTSKNPITILGKLGEYELKRLQSSVERENQDVVYWEQKKNVNKDYDWTIRFNNILKESTINLDNIYVLYNGEKVSGIQVTLNSDKKSIKIKAPQNGYQPGETYTLYIDKEVQSQKNQKLKNTMKMEFTIKEPFTQTEEQIQTFLNAYFNTAVNGDWGQYYDFWDDGKYSDWNRYAQRTTNKAEIEKLISKNRADAILSRKDEEAEYENAEISGGIELLEVLYNDKSCVSKIDMPDCLTLLIRYNVTATKDGKVIEKADSLAHAYIAKVSKDINDYGYIIEDDMDYFETE